MEHLQERQQSEYERLLAWTTLKEWLCSEDFKVRATFKFACQRTTLWQEVNARQAEHWHWWQGERGRELQRLLRRIPEVWQEQGWATFETTWDGRPRRAEYSESTLRKARQIYRDGHQFETPDSSYRWAESVLGETVRKHYTYLVVVSASVYREWFEEVGEGAVEGKTREEVAELLGVAKPLANELCRWITSTGNWKVVKNNCRREMRRVDR